MSASACEEDRCGGDTDGSVSLNIDWHDGEDDDGNNGGVGAVSVDGGRGGNSNTFSFWLILNIFTWQNWYIYQHPLLTMGSHHTKLFVWGFFKFV